jgi:hypothetical protein
MSASLVATGWWMYVDVPRTPNAVVICVILFNAFFGYRSVWRKPSFIVSHKSPSTAGVRFHGSILLKCVVFIVTDDSPVIAVPDYATLCPRQGCISIYRDKLVLQFHRRRIDALSSRGYEMASLPPARILLRLQFRCR